MTHDRRFGRATPPKKSVRRKISSQVSSAKGGSTTKAGPVPRNNPSGAARLYRAYSDAVKKQEGVLRRAQAAKKQVAVVKKRVQTIERQIKSARRVTKR